MKQKNYTKSANNDGIKNGLRIKDFFFYVTAYAMFFILQSPTANAQLISTYAGSGSFNQNDQGDGGPATNAPLGGPSGVTIDATGNVYFTDRIDNVIRMVNSAGVISTFAGTDQPSYSGDGGAATAATFNNPQGIEFDAAGNMYVADVNNNVIREISTSGIVSTVAGNNASGAGYSGDGGPATAAQLNNPDEVAIDAAGNLYIGDQGNNVIRKVDASGNITTVAGNNGLGGGYSGDGGAATDAQLNAPQGIAVDGSGNMYIADANNNVVRMVTAAGTISTIAGNGSGGYSGDGGPATDAQLNAPLRIEVDGAGNVYFSEINNNVIRMVNTSGIISTIAGNGTGGYSGDGGFATQAQLSAPVGLYIANVDSFYFADANNDVVRKVGLMPACTGAPTAGAITASQTSGCTAYTTNLSANSSIAGGLTYQWDSSTDGVNFTPVAGATSSTYNNVSVTASIYYRYDVTCTASSQTATSAATQFILTPEVAGTATLPYFQGFENWTGTCYPDDRPDTNWLESPTQGDNAWRRDDVGNDANWDFNYIGAYSPSSTEGSHSARFHSTGDYYSNNSNPGDLNLYVNLSAPGTKEITFDYINSDGFNDSYLSVMMDTTGTGQNFFQIGSSYNYTTGNWTYESITTTATSANTIIQFQGNVTNDALGDMGIDSLNIFVLPECTGMPVAGTFSNTQSSGCTPYNSTLTIDTAISTSGTTIQWQSSSDNINWTNVPGATDAVYNATITASIYYRFYEKCTNSGDSDFSASTEFLFVGTPAVATLPYFQSFENWTAACTTYELPDSNWQSNPPSGDNSWRRDDQGSDAGWDDGGAGDTYSPVFTQGAHSARFHSSEAGNEEGELDLHVNLSAPGTKTITFDYINTDGNDFLNVGVSSDGGITFTPLGTYNSGYFTGNTGWTAETITTTSVAANAIIRFAAVGDEGNSDIGIDSLNIIGPATPVCDSIIGLVVTNITQTGATLFWNTVSGTAGYEIVVSQSSATPATGTSVALNTYAATGLIPDSTYYVFVRDSCGSNSFSAWDTLTFTTLNNLSVTNVNNNQFGVNTYPNPTKDMITVTVSGSMGNNRKVTLMDVTGRNITTENMPSDNVKLDMSNLAAGIYMIHYEDDAQNKVIKVNKQ